MLAVKNLDSFLQGGKKKIYLYIYIYLYRCIQSTNRAKYKQLLNPDIGYQGINLSVLSAFMCANFP